MTDPIHEGRSSRPEDVHGHESHHHEEHEHHAEHRHHHREEHEHHHHHGHEHHKEQVAVKVNNKEVVFVENHVTGAVIKSTAIAQGVPIQQDFQLFLVRQGEPLKSIADTEHITLHDGEVFRATAPDDNSSENSHDR